MQSMRFLVHRGSAAGSANGASANRVGEPIVNIRAALFFLSTALWGAASVPVQAQEVLERIRSRGSVAIGHRESSVPFSYVVDGKPVGYSLDVCQSVVEAIARSLQIKSLGITYKQVTPATRFELVERGEIDLECGSTTNNAARRQRVAFTIPHFISAGRLLVLADSNVARLEDLDKRVIASTKGSTNIDSVAKEAMLKSLQVRIEPSKDHAEGVAWVLAGKVDAFAMDDVLLYGLRANSPQPGRLKIVGKSITVEPYAIAFSRNDPALKRVVDAEIRRLIFSYEINALYAKWFESPIPPKGANLAMRMPYLLLDSFKYPSDFVPN
jgi:ABC-type amino acid transport substrate-binding protein